MAKAQLFVVNFGSSQTGLGTVGYTIYRTNGTTYQARSTSGVVEYGASGIYGAMIERPDEDVVVLWDTGTGKYGAEDSRVMIDGISNETDKIKMIWNSIKNQGEFMAVIMEKLGALEKNIGIVSPASKDDVKSIIQDSVSKIKFPEIKIPEQKEIKIPEPYRYDEKFSEISKSIIDLNKRVAGIKVEKPDLAPVISGVKSISEELKQMIQSIKIPESKEYSGNFKNLEAMVEAMYSKISGDMGNKLGPLKADLAKTMAYFSKLDSLVSKMAEIVYSDQNRNLSDRDRDISVKSEIQKVLFEINKLNQAYSSYTKTDSAKDLLFMLGHRMK